MQRAWGPGNKASEVGGSPVLWVLRAKKSSLDCIVKALGINSGFSAGECHDDTALRNLILLLDGGWIEGEDGVECCLWPGLGSRGRW